MPQLHRGDIILADLPFSDASGTQAPGRSAELTYSSSPSDFCRCDGRRFALGAFFSVRTSRDGGASIFLPSNNSATVSNCNRGCREPHGES